MVRRVEAKPKLTPGTRVGEYEVVRSLDSGGHAEVFLVQCKGRYYALKMAHQRATRAEQRLVREHECLALFDHPNIVHVRDRGRWPDDNGWVYIVEDLVDGGPLLEWRERVKPTLRQIVQVFAQVARTLHEVHQRDLYHRDLKSENVLVSDDGHVTLIDFGIALKLDAPRLTPEDAVPGTRSHMSPEAVKYLSQRNRSAAGRFIYRPPAEMHAIGYMLYETLTGTPPFGAHVIVKQIPKRPSRLNPLVPDEVDAVTMKLLEKKPERRFQSARELALALEEIAARPERWWDAPFNVPRPRRVPTSEARFSSMTGAASAVQRWRSTAILAIGICVLLILVFGRRSIPPTLESQATCAALDGGIVPLVQGMLGMVIKGRVSPEQLLPPCPKPSVEIEASCWLEGSPGAVYDRAMCERYFVISVDDCVKNRRAFVPAKKGTMPAAMDH